ncbi:LCP family protein [Olsenella uli]|uniref:LCP family protein n=1 Tax=Olsenella uli TaxID=133926 RepID=UPI002570DCE9|nr:LCP family protein [Olsenella uli]
MSDNKNLPEDAQPTDAQVPLDELASSRAEGMRPSVAPRRRARDRFETAFQQDLEPDSPASARRARHMSAVEPAEDGDSGPRTQDEPTPAGEKNVSSRPERRRVPLAAKVLLGLIVCLGMVAGAAALWVGGLDSSMRVSDDQRAELDEALADPAPAAQEVQGSVFYALIIGSDARQVDVASRSDVIMLARVDTAHATVTLISIPRDTMISAQGGVEKINARYNYGPAATVRAVSEFAGVDISHYVEVNFEGLEHVVDALGGVTVTIPEDIPSGNGGMAFSAGEQTLTGEQALAYARERYNVSGGDFGRAQAQRQIVEAIVREVLASSPVELPGLVGQLAESISTDLSVADIASYALEIQRSGAALTIYSAATPSYSLSQGGVSYVATMYDEWRAMMQRVDAGLDPNDAAVQVPDEQLQNERLGAATNAAGPRDYAGLAASAGLTTDDVASLG